MEAENLPLRNHSAPAPAPIPPVRNERPLTRGQRQVIRAATIGFFVDVFDIYLPTVVLAPAMGYFAPTSMSVAASTTMFYVVFVVTLLARPVGAIVFGHIADSLGRRSAPPPSQSRALASSLYSSPHFQVTRAGASAPTSYSLSYASSAKSSWVVRQPDLPRWRWRSPPSDSAAKLAVTSTWATHSALRSYQF